MNILSISLSTSLLILAVVAMRAFFIHRLPKKTFLALWALALCRLLLPLSIPSRLNIHNIIIELLHAALPKEAALPALSPLTDIFILSALPTRLVDTAIAEVMPAALESHANIAINYILAMPWYVLLWMAGIIIFTLFFLLTHLRCRGAYKTALPIENLFVREWLDAHPIKRKICIKQSDKIDAPLAYGIWRPVILLPKDTDWQDENRLSYILMHEYVHIRRFDALWKWILAAALSLHWFNPLMWLMYVLANRDLELSCDETVLRKCGESAKHGYALTLINLAEKHKRLAPLVSNFSKNSVEERIVSIMKMRRVTKFGLLAAVFTVCLIAVVFATTAAPAALEPVADNSAGTVVAAAQTASDKRSGERGLVGSNSFFISADAYAADTFRFSEGRRERMLAIIKGENVVRVTYDGINWEPYDICLENEDWLWWSYEEYMDRVECIVNKLFPDPAISQEKVDNDIARYVQTLKDIKNGIKVSKKKENIYIIDPESTATDWEGWIAWYCFGYAFKNKLGENVDLGLFETRDQLFAALYKYYEQEMAEGHVTQREANTLYNEIAHSVRMEDEVPLFDKIANPYVILDNYDWFHL